MKLNSIIDTQNFSKRIARILKKGDVIFFFGNIGSGKTTSIRFIIHHLEKLNKLKNSEVLSPTFNIVYDYKIKQLKIMHYDLYRLKNNKDIEEIGIFEDSSKAITFIEWPELIKKKPINRIELYFKYGKKITSREVKLKFLGKNKNLTINEK